MSASAWLVKKLLRRNKKQTIMLIFTAAAGTADLFSAAALTIRGLRLFAERASQLGEPPLRLAWEGAGKLLYTTHAFILFIFKDDASFVPSASELFDEAAVAQILPSLQIFTLLCGILIAFLSIRAIFAVLTEERRHLYASMLLSGASASFVRKCAGAEATYLCMTGIPAGLLAGIAEIALLNGGERLFDRICMNSFSAQIRPAGIPVSATAALFACAAGALFIRSASKRTYKKLSLKNAAVRARERLGANIGVRAFSPDAANLRLLGYEHYIALRNISNHIEKYGYIFLSTAGYLIIGGVSTLSFVITRQYNAAAFSSGNDEAGQFLCASAYLFLASAVVIQLFSTVGTLFEMLSNFRQNREEYALMRTLGASVRSTRRAVRREGLLCALFGAGFGLAGTVFVFSLLALQYHTLAGWQGLLASLSSVGFLLILFIASVAAACSAASRDLENLDVVKVLKEFSAT